MYDYILYNDPLDADLEMMIHFVFFAGTLAVILALLSLVKQFRNERTKERREAFRQLLQPFLYPLACAMYRDAQYPDADVADIDKPALRCISARINHFAPTVAKLITALAESDGDCDNLDAMREGVNMAVLRVFFDGGE